MHFFFAMSDRDRIRPPRLPFYFSRAFLAPLLIISVALHVGLLFFPLPSVTQDLPEEEETPDSAEAEVVDLLSISSLATEPVPETPPEAPPPEAAAPAPQPQAPTQPVVPENYEQLPEPSPEETLPPDSPPEDFNNEDSGTAGNDMSGSGFDVTRQQNLVSNVAGAIGRAPGTSNFDITPNFPSLVPPQYLSAWSQGEVQCYFTSLTGSSFTLVPAAADLRYLSRNIENIENEDLPRTFAGQTLQKIDGGFCGSTFYQVSENGSPILWVSLVSVSPGGSTALVIFWQQDPRTS